VQDLHLRTFFFVNPASDELAVVFKENKRSLLKASGSGMHY